MQFVEDNDEEPDFATREEQRGRRRGARRSEGRQPRSSAASTPTPKIDEALRPVYEAGGGEQDGFELAEHDLERNASHDDGGAFPERDAFTPEVESDRSTAEYGESDGERAARLRSDSPPRTGAAIETLDRLR